MRLVIDLERATRFELANSSLGSYCLTTWRRPLELGYNFTAIDAFCKKNEYKEEKMFRIAIILIDKEFDCPSNLIYRLNCVGYL